MKKCLIFIMFVSIFLISCATVNTSISLKQKYPDGIIFYVQYDEALKLCNSIAEEIEKQGYEAKIINSTDELEDIYRAESSGTGFFISPNLIVTNAHVVDDIENVKFLKAGIIYDGKVILQNRNNDLALIETDSTNDKYFELISSKDYNIADTIFVMGYPMSDILGGDIKVTNGVVSALSGTKEDQNYIQISAPIQPGNSGGPVMNYQYKVVGIATASLSEVYVFKKKNTLPQNVNFAIKSDIAKFLFSDKVKDINKNNVVSNINDAISATVQIKAGIDKLGNKKAFYIDTNYTYFFDLIHYTLSEIDMTCYDVKNGNVVSNVNYYGASLSSAKSIAKDTTKTLLNKIK